MGYSHLKNDAAIFLALAGVGAAAFFLLRPRDTVADGSAAYVPFYGTGTALREPVPYSPPADEPGWWETVTGWLPFGDSTDEYKSPIQWREELRPLFRRMESAYAMPDGLLEAVAERESAFRHDIITCETVGKVGEEGIMQLRPEYHLASRAERCNPKIAIPYAAKFLAKQYLRFNSWDEAIAAYNWGPTNLANFGILAAPQKTKEYVAFVTTTIGIRG